MQKNTLTHCLVVGSCFLLCLIPVTSLGEAADDSEHTGPSMFSLKNQRVAPRWSSIAFSKTTNGPEVEWNYTYGGSNDEECYGVCQTQDGGFVCTGVTDSYGSDNLWLLKVDENGTEVWNQSFGGSEWDIGVSVIELDDGSLIVIGIKESYGDGNADAWLLKTDEFGEALWNKTYGGSDYEEVYTIVEIQDAGFLFGGLTESYGAGSGDAWVVRTDPDGVEIWNQTYGGSAWDWIGIEGIAQTASGDFVFAGQTDSYATDDSDLWVIYTDEAGVEYWNKTYGGIGWQMGFAIQVCDDGQFAVAGMTNENGGSSEDIWLLKIHQDGTVLWNQSYGGTQSDECWSLQQTRDRGFLLVGSTYSYSAGSSDLWVIQTDADGNEKWNQSFGGSQWDYGTSVRLTADRGAIICGITKSFTPGFTEDVWLIKLATLSSPVLNIDISRGIGVSVEVKNSGEVDATNVFLDVHVKGGIIGGISQNASDSLSVLPADNASSLSVRIIPFGFGKVEVNVIVVAENHIQITDAKSGIVFFIFFLLH